MDEPLATGWSQLAGLHEGRSPRSYRDALLSDLAALDQGHDASPRANSLLRVTDLLARDVVWLQVEGSFGALEDFRIALAEVLRLHPALTRLRDLKPVERAGCTLDILLQSLELLRTLPSSRRATALFEPSTRGAGLRRAVMRCLAASEEWLATSEVLQRIDAAIRPTKQGLHGALATLREHGLVVRDPQGPGHCFRLSLAGRQTWRSLEGTQSQPVPDSADASPIASEVDAFFASLEFQLSPEALQASQVWQGHELRFQ